MSGNENSRWRLERLLWENVVTGRSDPSLEDIILDGGILADALGGDAYADLIIEFYRADDRDGKRLGQDLLNRLFPRACQCRKPSDMDCDEFQFGERVYRRLFYIDDSVTADMRVLFRRTPDIDLMACDKCGDVWIRGMDQDWLRQHLVLLNPGDLERIKIEHIWPSEMDVIEDVWTAAVGGLHRNAPELMEWQRQNNTEQAFNTFAK